MCILYDVYVLSAFCVNYCVILSEYMRWWLLHSEEGSSSSQGVTAKAEWKCQELFDHTRKAATFSAVNDHISYRIYMLGIARRTWLFMVNNLNAIVLWIICYSSRE